MVSEPNNDIEGFIQKFIQKGLKENPLDVLLKLLIKEEELPSLRKEFKDKYLKPLLKNWEKISNDVNKNTTKTSDIFEKLENVIDSKISEIKSENKNPNKPKQDNKTDSKSTDSFDLGFLKNIYNNKKEEPQKEEPQKEEPQKEEPQKEKKPESVISFLPELLDKLFGKKEEKQQEPQKEKLLQGKLPETVISFSKDAMDVLEKMSGKFLKGQEDGNKKVSDSFMDAINNLGGIIKGRGILGFITDLITSLPMMLAAIGGATVLAGMFWPEIKKFIGDKFGDKASEIFDQFQGTVNAIGKFVTMGGFKFTIGKTFSSIGTFLGTLADDLLMSFKGIFLGLADNSVGGFLKGTTAALSSGGLKGLLKTGAGAILKGVSKVALKAIPLIGSVISFADAYGRFKEGEILQGTIDIAAGLAGLVPGWGTAFSIGLSLLNAFIDFKSGEEKEQIKTQAVSISSMLLKGVGFLSKTLGKGVLRKLPLIGTMLTLASAWEKFKQGEILSGTLDVASGLVSLIPGLGIPLSIGIDLLNSFISTPENKENGVQRFGFSITTMAMKALSYFAKFGRPFFKRLPLIGTLLSFGSAWDRFQQNNITGGLLDVVSGIATLVPGIGTGISIGLDVLNMFLDSKDETGQPKSAAVGNFFKGIWEKFKTTGVFKAFFSLSEGLSKLVTGNLKDGMKDLSKLPYIGGMFSGIANWLNEPTDQPTAPTTSNKHPLSDTSKKIIENLPKEYSKEEEDKLHEERTSVVNERTGIEKEIENLNNTKTKDEADEISKRKIVDDLEKKKQELFQRQKNINFQTRRYKELKEGKKLTTLEDYEAEAVARSIPIQDGVSGDGDGVNLFKDAINYSSTSSQLNGLTFQPPNAQKLNIVPDKGDQVLAMKRGGAIDNTFEKLNESIDNLNKRIESLVKIQIDSNKNSNQQELNSPVIINNSTTQTQSQPRNIKFSGERDEIYLTRMDWLRNNSYSRIS